MADVSVRVRVGAAGAFGKGNLRQLHAHEDSGHEEAEEHADAANEEQQEAVEFGNVRSIGAVQDDEAQAPHGEEEAGGQPFHNVLPIDSGRELRSAAGPAGPGEGPGSRLGRYPHL